MGCLKYENAMMLFLKAAKICFSICLMDWMVAEQVSKTAGAACPCMHVALLCCIMATEVCM